jgi:hypothetical protein
VPSRFAATNETTHRMHPPAVTIAACGTPTRVRDDRHPGAHRARALSMVALGLTLVIVARTDTNARQDHGLSEPDSVRIAATARAAADTFVMVLANALRLSAHHPQAPSSPRRH